MRLIVYAIALWGFTWAILMIGLMLLVEAVFLTE